MKSAGRAKEGKSEMRKRSGFARAPKILVLTDGSLISSGPNSKVLVRQFNSFRISFANLIISGISTEYCDTKYFCSVWLGHAL